MMKNVALSILMVGLLAACASEKPKEAPKQETPAAGTQQPAAETMAPKAAEPVAVDPLDDPNSMLAKRSVYYPFDVSVVQSADRPLVEEHAKYLSANPGSKVRLEGNCDERGSNEYNLALGQRRADGVKKLLLAGGVKADQIDTVSNGEEKPKLTCHEEKCWQENRRTDLIYSK
ncbi:MAG TPA: peptidoglycan-associated lipoprotein Pal [Gallionellaceae bacterium]|nr:peptidoglycan-associated lipoprotein Pal [Gallionellaceae bacterium]